MRLSLLMLLMFPVLVHAELKIVTTTTDFADIARQIGGDKVDVHSVMKGPENVHNVLAKPTEMIHLNKADLLVHSGLDSEPWRDNLMKGARNPRILPNKPGNVDMSNGIELKDVPTGRIDRSMGDVHAYGNPHYSCNPQNAQRMAATLVRAMINADPANADLYRENAKKFVNEMADVSRAIKQEFAPYAGAEGRHVSQVLGLLRRRGADRDRRDDRAAARDHAVGIAGEGVDREDEGERREGGHLRDVQR